MIRQISAFPPVLGNIWATAGAAAKALELKRTASSEKGFDATNRQGKRYQIKGRRLTDEKRSTELSVLRDLSQRRFDFLVVIYFDEHFEIREAVRIAAHEAVVRHAAYNWDTSAYRFVMSARLREGAGCVDITHLIRLAWGT